MFRQVDGTFSCYSCSSRQHSGLQASWPETLDSRLTLRVAAITLERRATGHPSYLRDEREVPRRAIPRPFKVPHSRRLCWYEHADRCQPVTFAPTAWHPRGRPPKRSRLPGSSKRRRRSRTRKGHDDNRHADRSRSVACWLRRWRCGTRHDIMHRQSRPAALLFDWIERMSSGKGMQRTGRTPAPVCRPPGYCTDAPGALI